MHSVNETKDLRTVEEVKGTWHPTHRMRFSDSSLYDYRCQNCGKHDALGYEHLLSYICEQYVPTNEVWVVQK